MSLNSYTTRAARRLGYRSGFEAYFAEELEKYGIKYEYESEKCKLSYCSAVKNAYCLDCGKGKGNILQEHTYTVDFYLPEHDVFIETKGRFTSPDRNKHELIHKQYPELKLFILFEYDGKATPKRRYSEWCEWKGICYGIVPKKRTKTDEGRYLPAKWLEEWRV